VLAELRLRRPVVPAVLLGVLVALVALVGRDWSFDAAAAAAPTAGRSCPRSQLARFDTKNRRAVRHLVPAPALSARVCQYKGVSGGGRFHIVLHGRLIRSGPSLRVLTRRFDELRPISSGEAECESGRNLWYLVIFSYSEGSPVYVHVNFVGCGLVRNGASRRLYQPSGKLERALAGSI
jgi:hypothetical protein